MIIKGQKINDRYQIIRTIGEGGMANVYLAYDTILDRNVAVKILRGDLADDEKFVRRFQREAISASSLTHPNIVEMYDVGEDDGKYFIVMEFVDGRTLKNLIKKRGALTLPEVVDIMLQLTSAISCAHDSYIIHRDIKPQNVLILEDGRVKITDFGIAMALNSNELTQTNSVMGSVHYLPPEQANGSGSTIKSDIYSLGILMYELLIGKVPFKGDSAVEIAIKQMRDPLPSVCSLNSNIPQSIENILLKACAKNPKNRYDNVNEMHEDIRVALNLDHEKDARIVYKYSEQDLEETKVMEPIKDKEKTEEKVVAQKNSKKGKTLNIILLITGIILFLLVSGLGLFILLFPKMSETPDVKIPDVSNKTVEEAEALLKENKLQVDIDLKYESNNDIEEGKVIRTSPRMGGTVKQDTTITLIVSSGANTTVLENYVGKNYYEVKAALELKEIYVTIEKQEVEDKSKYKENIIIKQSVEEGKVLKKGEQIILFSPDLITTYPNFRDGSWSVSDIQTFCDEYNIDLTISYQETDQYKEGTIISQSRLEGVKVMSGTSLKITVAKKPNIPDLDDIVPVE